ncbi:ATP-dependent helicase [Bartonella ancashensis]|uniref:DNA 3'-5' helicase n=1 Tax=Bartonella ancashensis TaxID=1318743 RepID=A0A0M3T304_9HYPH|nr:UvrD-helicase domain-containing protein [Bartonella ancashensis]ALE03635.1 ATP-dependent DNA helicase UvrD/PcrA [Bartonella ancashensis]
MSDVSDHIPFFEDEAPLHKLESCSKLITCISTKEDKIRPEPDYLKILNTEQRQAVMNTEGPILVLAGAGTGKTRVLTTRIAYILHLGLAHPRQILAVTFTNKAAREIKIRIGELVGETVEGMPWLGTFHSTCAKILRRHAELVNLKSNFTILDNDDTIRLLKQIIQAGGLDDKRWPARSLAAMIDSWKNQGLSPEHISESDSHSFGSGMGRKLYYDYQNRLKSLNACDFGDLLLHSIHILQHNKDILHQYHNTFRYILVDEYQDTNTAQYLWLRLLAQHTQKPINLCCVGDDDQSIYGWRGAKIDNILRFEKDFPPAKLIRLERNYRSTSHILKTASHLISHNQERLGKTLFADEVKSEETKVKIHTAWDSEEEARAIGGKIEHAQKIGHSLNQIAILVRASFQMREFEDRFVTLGLNYRVIGGPRFYERMEIRDAMAYLRVIVQPADDLAFERILNTPKRGLGDATLRHLYDSALTCSIPLFSAAVEVIKTDKIKPKARDALQKLIENFSRWKDMLQRVPHTELVETILDESGYIAMLQKDRSPETPARLENLKEMVRSMERFESLQNFLEHVSLVMETDNNENVDAINIMTLHSAKGLEFDTVFLPGWEEGLFPHQRSLDEGGRLGLEEERRLAYVGITRAKKHLYIWFVSNRRVHGLWQSTLPSRFINELPEEHVEVEKAETFYGGYSQLSSKHQDPFYNNYSTPGWQRAQKNQTEATRNNWGKRSAIHAKQIDYDDSPSRLNFPFPHKEKNSQIKTNSRSTSDPKSIFSIGDRIFHIKFGYGHILTIDENKLTILFDKAGEKRVLENFVTKA